MARRYADERKTFTPSILNECVDKLLQLGVKLKIDPLSQSIYAKDGDFDHSPMDDKFQPGNPVAFGHIMRLPPGRKLDEEIMKALDNPKNIAEALEKILEMKNQK